LLLNVKNLPSGEASNKQIPPDNILGISSMYLKKVADSPVKALCIFFLVVDSFLFLQHSFILSYFILPPFSAR